MPRNKYGNNSTEYNGMKFDSKAECDRYKELELMQRAKGSNRIYNLRRQVKFVLIEKQPDESAVTYTADFAYVQNGDMIVEDVKSVATAKDKAYIIKRKMFKQKYKDYQFREVLR